MELEKCFECGSEDVQSKSIGRYYMYHCNLCNDFGMFIYSKEHGIEKIITFSYLYVV